MTARFPYRVTNLTARPTTEAATFVVFCSIFLIANLSVGAMPVLFGGFVDQRHLGLAVAGSIATSETTGLAIGSALALALIAKFGLSERVILAASLVTSAAAQIQTAISSDVAILIAARMISGISTSLIQSTAIAWISRQASPQRSLAIFVSMAFLAGAIGIPLFTFTLQTFGLSGTFLTFAGLLLAVIMMVPLVPRTNVSTAQVPRVDQYLIHGSPINARQWPLLLAISLNFLVNSGLWIYLERIGQWGGIAATPLATILGFGMFAAMGGTIALGIAGHRVKAVRVIMLAHLMLIGSSIVFFSVGSWAPFASAVAIFNIGVALLPPTLLAILAKMDPSGKSSLQGLTAINVGYAIGPQAYSWMMTSLGLTVSLAATIAVFAVSLTLCTRGLRAV